MKNYIYVATMTLTIAGSLFVYKSCTTGVPSIAGIGIKVPIIGGPAKPTVHNNTSTVTTVVTKPNGETVATTTTVDKTVVNPPRRLRIELGAAVPYNNIKAAPTYDLGVSYRVFEHVWLGGAVYSDKKVGFRIGVDL